jgi:23S rRNA (adenine2503-C2)-methyltransferase
MEIPRLIYDLNYDELVQLLAAWGEPAYRARQIWQGLYQQYYGSADQFSTLPSRLRERLESELSLGYLAPTTVLHSSDGETIKTLFSLPDQRAIEAVLMRYERRRTLCISTQAGCAMGCVFCATGQMGFMRHLSKGEIIEQVIYYARLLRQQQEQVTNVVLMGMGEPFHNYEATMQAIDQMNSPGGMGLSARRFTVSTVGLIPVIQRFASEKRQVNLAISLHAADDELRSSLLPINKKYPLADLFQACLEYVNITHRRISFEWALIQGVNDSQSDAKKLADRLQDFRHGAAALCHVNIIPLNPTRRYAGQATQRTQARLFQAELVQRNIPCTIRIRRGIDIQAGCGQLAIESN